MTTFPFPTANEAAAASQFNLQKKFDENYRRIISQVEEQVSYGEVELYLYNSYITDPKIFDKLREEGFSVSFFDEEDLYVISWVNGPPDLLKRTEDVIFERGKSTIMYAIGEGEQKTVLRVSTPKLVEYLRDKGYKINENEVSW